MTEGPTVVKVGGSLFDMPDLGVRLGAWLKALGHREVILIAGGGAVADVVRDLDLIHGLGERWSHWLAVRSLSVTADALMAILPGSAHIQHEGLRLPVWCQMGFPILDLADFVQRDESRPDHLPHCWDVTSDSLSARVAEVLQARELILLKSVTIPPDIDWTEASRHGLVDGFFPTMIARGVRARAVNLREWQP
jgi:aspartokinase-like uncharacterized kinase